KFQTWTNPAHATPEEAVDRDQLLTNVSLYWFTRSGASSAQFYWEAEHSGLDWLATSGVPLGWVLFDTHPLARKVLDPWGAIGHWTEPTEGGHFPAMEEPGLLAAEPRDFFRPLTCPRASPSDPPDHEHPLQPRPVGRVEHVLDLEPRGRERRLDLVPLAEPQGRGRGDHVATG